MRVPLLDLKAQYATIRDEVREAELFGVDEPDWSLSAEWNRWVAVERLANNPQRIAEMSREFERADDASFRPFYEKWPDVLENYMRRRSHGAR